MKDRVKFIALVILALNFPIIILPLIFVWISKQFKMMKGEDKYVDTISEKLYGVLSKNNRNRS